MAKLVAAAGPSLAAIPSLPSHLLERYLELSLQLQRYRLRSTASSLSPQVVPRNGHLSEGGVAAGDAGGTAAGPWQEGVNLRGGGRQASSDPPPPPLHAGSLRLFLGCLCRMLGERPANADQNHHHHNCRQERCSGAGAGGEVEEVLRMLVESEVRCLGGVLDRRRELGEHIYESRGFACRVEFQETSRV